MQTESQDPSLGELFAGSRQAEIEIYKYWHYKLAIYDRPSDALI